MSEMRPARVLHEMCDIVERELAAHPMRMSEQSYFANMLNTIGQLDRRHLIQTYVFDALKALLLGVIDQARCMALVLDTSEIVVTPFIVMRTLIEYSDKITYISDPCIDDKERIRRVLALLYNDIIAYRKLPEDLRSDEEGRQSQEIKQYVTDWYRQLTEKDIAKLSAQSISDDVWKSGLEMWQESNKVPNDRSEMGYRIGSAFQHGNIWALQHYRLDKLPEKRFTMVVDFLRLAGVLLQFSFGFVVQFMFITPTVVMNELEQQIGVLESISIGAFVASRPN